MLPHVFTAFFGRFHHFEAYPFKLSSFCDCIFYCETKQGDFPFLTSHRRGGLRFRVGWFPVSAEMDRQALEAVPKFGTSCLEIV